jgi:hypothetical protein
VELGFETIGNATVICHDRVPVLVTDPWIDGPAYFGSWAHEYVIPEEQRAAIRRCPFVWLSHGHPDHTSLESLDPLREKTILVADHVGGRMADGLRQSGFRVQVLADGAWQPLSDRIRVLCVADPFQDSVLLIDVGGRLLVNQNDTQEHGWEGAVAKIVRGFPASFLLKIAGFGDADMINFFDEAGAPLPCAATHRDPVGQPIARAMTRLGTRYFVPFSSFHRYQRRDSLWAEQHRTLMDDYAVGFYLEPDRFLPAFIRYDCTRDRFTEIRPAATPATVIEPEALGDRWADELEAADVAKLRAYFLSFEHLRETLTFVRFRVGGKETVLDVGRPRRPRGLTFEVPRQSLMQAVEWEIFDDLLIANFMKTTLHGAWGPDRLHPDFTPYVGKYGDNGRARTREELERYFATYRQRGLVPSVLDRVEARGKQVLRDWISPDSKVYRTGKRVYWALRASEGRIAR